MDEQKMYEIQKKAYLDAMREERLNIIIYNSMMIILSKLVFPCLLLWSIYYFGVKRPLQKQGLWVDYNNLPPVLPALKD